MNKFTHCLQKNSAGLTLIEVLIALAIIAIALTAVIKASSQSIRATTYLQEKTIAYWVGEQVLNETRAGVLSLNASEESRRMTTMLNRNWYWQAKIIPTPNLHIKKIEVKVYASKEDNNDPLIFLESYVYQKGKTNKS